LPVVAGEIPALDHQAVGPGGDQSVEESMDARSQDPHVMAAIDSDADAPERVAGNRGVRTPQRGAREEAHRDVIGADQHDAVGVRVREDGVGWNLDLTGLTQDGIVVGQDDADLRGAGQGRESEEEREKGGLHTPHCGLLEGIRRIGRTGRIPNLPARFGR
jgi:hypothetical protein